MYYVDIHCHSTLKPFGQNFNQNNDISKKNSIWYYDPPTFDDKLIEYILGFSRYSQSNFTAAAFGNAFVMGVSLYAPEVAFFNNKLGDGKISSDLENFITLFGEQNKYGINAWDSVCIGSDFDGIINPINGFWTEEEMPLFEKYLKKHVCNYLGTAKLIQKNKFDADETVSKVMYSNAMTFLKNNF